MFFQEKTSNNQKNISIIDPYIDSARHIRTVYKRQAEYFAAYNEAINHAKAQHATELNPVMFNMQQTAKTLVRLCMYQLADRRKKATTNDNKVSSKAHLELDPTQPFVLSTNRVRIQKELHCSSLATVDNHLHRLEEAGFIVNREFYGTRANIELYIHPAFLLISDHANHAYDPAKSPIPPIALPQKLGLFYNNKENFKEDNNASPQAVNNVKIFSQPAEEESRPEELEKIFAPNTGRDQESLKKESISEREPDKENTRECKGEPESCKICTEKHLVKKCKNCAGKVTTNSWDVFGAESIIRCADDAAYRLRYYVTLLISYAFEQLFYNHKIYETEKTRVFNLIMERRDVYFRNCVTLGQYRWALGKYFERIKMAAEYARRNNFSFANIYPVAYFDPDSGAKCNFSATEAWLKRRKEYKEQKEVAKKRRAEHKLLFQIFDSLRNDPCMDNFLHCEAVMTRNIPTYQKTLYMFYQGLLNENNLYTPNTNEN